MIENFNVLLNTDSYKLFHRVQYPSNTTTIYSNFTPRSSRVKGQKYVVMFGLQYFIKEYLINRFNNTFFKRDKDTVVEEYRAFVSRYCGLDTVDTAHIEELHDLGYLPLIIKALPEGTKCPIGLPVLTIRNTDDRFAWLTNYVETMLSNVLWHPITSATTAHIYKEVFNKYSDETVGNRDFVQWQGHNFSYRGLCGTEAACLSDGGHLLSFTGSDTMPSTTFLDVYYNADSQNNVVSGSVAATEHSCEQSGILYEAQKNNLSLLDAETNFWEYLITKACPTGILSVVADTFDYFACLTQILPKLKDKILARNGKVVVRPDSGDPVKIIVGEIYEDYTTKCKNLEEATSWAQADLVEKVRRETPHGEYGDSNPSAIFKFKDVYYQIVVSIDWNRHDKQYYYIDGRSVKSCTPVKLTPEQKGSIELLWEVFDGKVNELGYKELDPHIGLIYGDSITLERQQLILEGLKQKGFAANNVVLGIGSFTYQFVTRDTYGFAVKSTYVIVDGVEIPIYKDPKTDNGMKKSAKGLLQVYRKDGELKLKQECTWDEECQGELKPVFMNSVLLVDQTLAEIRTRLNEG